MATPVSSTESDARLINLDRLREVANHEPDFSDIPERTEPGRPVIRDEKGQLPADLRWNYRSVNPHIRSIPVEAVADLSDDEVEFQAEMDRKLRNRPSRPFGEACDR